MRASVINGEKSAAAVEDGDAIAFDSKAAHWPGGKSLVSATLISFA